MKKDEKSILLQEWYNYSKADLEAAEILYQQTKNYYISVYHSHQSIEKIIKWFLLKNNKQFPYIHDLEKLLLLIKEFYDTSLIESDLKMVNDLFPLLRYPSIDRISKEKSIEAYQLAKKIFELFSKELNK